MISLNFYDPAGHLLIVCDTPADLRDLARRAGLQIAAGCACARCGWQTGQHGCVDGAAVLDAIAAAQTHT